MNSQTKQFLMEEVTKHNKADDLWLVVDGKVYDVTTFLNHHPGGTTPYLKRAGTDATQAFHNINKHLINVGMTKLLEKYMIGILQTE